MNSGTKRLFVAIGLPQEISQKLAEVQTALRRFARDAKWVNIEGIHLTLKFLGYVESGKISDISRILTSTSKLFPVVPIKVMGCGFFPNSRRPNVLWTGVDSRNLLPVQKAVEDSLAELAFEKEKRAFTPHLTLARFRDPKGLIPLVQEAEKWKETSIGEFVAQSFSLYESILHPKGAKYNTLETFPFQETRNTPVG